MSINNDIYYKYHPPIVTKESIIDDIKALPKNKDYKDKYYVGYFDNDKLIAVMDLILSYPNAETALIGLFMLDIEYQGKEIGSSLIKDLLKYLKEFGYQKIRIGVDKGNPQSNYFWKKNGFVEGKEADSEYIVMERII